MQHLVLYLYWRQRHSEYIMSLNKQVKIILIETTNSGNIGSALRAMKTMGFDNLCLVSPKDFPSEDVVTMAANAKDLIANIQVTQNLDEALEGINFVVGTSSRMRKVPWPNEALDNVAATIVAETIIQILPLYWQRG